MTDFEEVLADDVVDAVCIVTPISTHYDMGKAALLAGKHVFVEKPMASSVKECDELIEIAGERDLVLMPGHTFLYSPPVLATKERLDSGEIGKLYFGTSSRVNLGHPPARRQRRARPRAARLLDPPLLARPAVVPARASRATRSCPARSTSRSSTSATRTAR